MSFKENDVVYWNDPKSSGGQSGIVQSKNGDQYVVATSDGGTIKAKESELEPL